MPLALSDMVFSGFADLRSLARVLASTMSADIGVDEDAHGFRPPRRTKPA